MNDISRVGATEVARFRTLAGQMRNDSLKYTRVVRSGIDGHVIQCSACGQAGSGGFKFQSDATSAARTHANRCLA
ncbi:hypothetical protein OHQ89_12450 [Streptomyces canus]|uniref:hypothetical protein n=1 Tax=Streptomyces canus TaxID=58343 RepID=UPI0030DF98D3